MQDGPLRGQLARGNPPPSSFPSQLRTHLYKHTHVVVARGKVGHCDGGRIELVREVGTREGAGRQLRGGLPGSTEEGEWGMKTRQVELVGTIPAVVHEPSRQPAAGWPCTNPLVENDCTRQDHLDDNNGFARIALQLHFAI